jgi:thiol-disulfide isomerase/thioredoxin
MRFKLFLLLLWGFSFSYEVGDKVTYLDQNKRYDICHGASNNGLGETLSLSDFNGSNSNFHVFFFDMSASWCGPCVSFAQTTMAAAEEAYHNHENVRIFSNLDDIGEPYRCSQWGNFGGPATLITDDGVGSGLWGKFNTGSAYPSVVFIDHTMTIIYKQSAGPSISLINSLINDMLDDLYSALLISANFTHDFTSDIDGDGLINPGDSFDLLINVFNKSYDESNTALNVNIELVSDDGIIITSQDIGNIGDINAQDSFQIEANIAISDDIEIKDYLLNLVVSTTDSDGDEIVEEFQTDFTVTLNQSGFPADVLGELISSAAVVDFDNDGEDEIIFGDYHGIVHIINNDGSELFTTVFPFDTGAPIWSSPAAADLDGNGLIEVVITSKSKHLYIFENGELKVNFNTELYDVDSSGVYLIGTPAIGNLDDDAELEVVFSGYSNNNKLFVINHDGSLVDGFPIPLYEKVKRGVALADFNNNDKDDIVLGTDAVVPSSRIKYS